MLRMRKQEKAIEGGEIEEILYFEMLSAESCHIGSNDMDGAIDYFLVQLAIEGSMVHIHADKTIIGGRFVVVSRLLVNPMGSWLCGAPNPCL